MTTTTENNAHSGEFARLVAAYSAKGHTLRRCLHVTPEGPQFVASNWGYCKPLANIEEVREFLHQIGGKHVL